MADITNLTQFLEDVADAIRTKKQTSEPIPAAEFDSEILSIEIGIDTSDADAIEENIEKGKVAYARGEKIIGTLGDAGGSADVMVSVDNITIDNERGWDCISTKYTNSGKKIYKDGWYVNQHMKFEDLVVKLDITPEKIAKGSNILGVEGVVEVNNQDKTITENGVYTADEGYTGLGEITVNVQASSAEAQNIPFYMIEQDDEGNLYVVNNYEKMLYIPYTLDEEGNFIVNQDDTDTAIYCITENMELEVAL